MGDAVSFLLTQSGVEIPVSGLSQPVRLTVPLSDAGALMRGQPVPRSLSLAIFRPPALVLPLVLAPALALAIGAVWP